MTTYCIGPDVQVEVYPPRSDKAHKLPMDQVSEVVSSRGMGTGSIQLYLKSNFDRSLLPLGSVVYVDVKKSPKDPWRQLNAGYVSSLTRRISAEGKDEITPEIQSFDEKLRQQTYYVDANPVGDTGKKPPAPSTSAVPATNDSRIKAAFTAYEKAIKQIGSSRVQDMLESYWNSIIVDLLNVQVTGATNLYGGKRLVGMANGYDGHINLHTFKQQSYTSGFLSVLNFLSNINFGAELNFYDFFTQLLTQPLYDIFTDPLEGEPGFYGGLIEPEAGNYSSPNDTNNHYEVKPRSALMIVRPTPYWIMWKPDGTSDPAASALQMTQFFVPEATRTVDFTEDLTNVYSGLHIISPMFGLDASSLFYPATFNPALRAIVGHRILSINVDGLQSIDDKGNRVKLNDRLQFIQEQFFKWFCAPDQIPLRHITGTISGAFDFIRTGCPIVIPELPIKTGYGNIGYVESVTDRFRAKGEAATSISVKFIDEIN